jgi:hypothetical protein
MPCEPFMGKAEANYFDEVGKKMRTRHALFNER